MNAVLNRPVRATQRRSHRPPGQLLFRSCTAHVVACARGIAPHTAAAQLFEGDATLPHYLAVQKAAIDPALTSVPDWAGNLAREQWGEFLGLLAPVSVYAQLAALGSRWTYTKGKVHVPARNGTPTLAGDFVAENAPIPVRKASFRSTALGPKKLAVISAFSAEVSSGTGGEMEDTIKDAMLEDSAVLLDTRLLDDQPASDVRPAGLLNGATVTPSADMATDLRAALAPILTAGGGRKLVWLVNPLQALSLCTVTNGSGGLLYPNADERLPLGGVIVSPNVPDGTLIVLDAFDFATAADAVPQFRVSEEGVLHMDNDPDPLVDTTMASPITSLFQMDLLAVRMVQQLNWAMRRPDMVSAITGIAW